VVGTFGRGIYVLDDYTPLRHLDAATMAESGAILPARPALEYLQSSRYGAPGKADNGAAFFTADNLGPSALVSYWIKTVPQTLQQDLQRRERAAERAGTDFTPYPTAADNAAMAAQGTPAYSLVISDAAGHPIRVLGVPARAGLGRISWDLRLLASPTGGGRGRGGAAAAPPAGGRGGRGGAAAPVAPPEGGGTPGALVLPGRYSVALYQHWDGKWTALGAPGSVTVVADPASTPPLAAMQAHVAFLDKLDKLQAAVNAATAYAGQISTELTTLRATAAAQPVNHQALVDATDAAQKAFDAIERDLRGGGFGGEGPVAPGISTRIGNASGAERQSLSAPTQTSLDDYQWASEALTALLPQLQRFATTTMPQLEQQFIAAGAPVPNALPKWPQ